MPIDASAIERGYLVKNTEKDDESRRIKLDFNPVSLTCSVEAAAQQQSAPNRTGQSQYAAQFSSKLSFDAIFDNTDTGEDVRLTTTKVAEFLQPAPPAEGSNADSGLNAPALVLFHWGAFLFTGILTQYRETIEFFSKEGVPLRSTVGLTFVKQDRTLEVDPHAPTTSTGGSLVPTGSNDSALSAATRGGDPRAARALASANSLESIRFTGGRSLEVGASAQASVSASAGFGASASFDASSTWNESGSGGLFGGKTSAGVSASAGAFAGVSARGGASASASPLDPTRMLAGTSVADLSAHAGASFSLGGVAQMGVGVGLSADVGAKASWRDLLQFDDEA